MNREIYASESLVKLAKDLGYDYDPDAMINDVNQYALANIQKWFREKHEIHIEIRRLCFGTYVEYNDFIYLKGSEKHSEVTLGNEFDTYEEALQSALIDCCMILKGESYASGVLE